MKRVKCRACARAAALLLCALAGPAAGLSLPGEREPFDADELCARFGYDRSESGGITTNSVFLVHAGGVTNEYRVVLPKCALQLKEDVPFAGVDVGARSLLGPELGAFSLGWGRERPAPGLVPSAGAPDEFECRPERPFRSFTKVYAYRALDARRVGRVYGSEKFATAAEADAEAAAVAAELSRRFGVVPERFIPGRAWLFQTRRCAFALIRQVIDGREAVYLALLDKLENTLFLSL